MISTFKRSGILLICLSAIGAVTPVWAWDSNAQLCQTLVGFCANSVTQQNISNSIVAFNGAPVTGAELCPFIEKGAYVLACNNNSALGSSPNGGVVAPAGDQDRINCDAYNKTLSWVTSGATTGLSDSNLVNGDSEFGVSAVWFCKPPANIASNNSVSTDTKQAFLTLAAKVPAVTPTKKPHSPN